MQDNTEVLSGFNDPVEFSRWSFHLDDDIREPSYYRNLIEVLVNASPEDQIKIYINSNGGRADSMIAITNAIQSCHARVIGILVGSAYSAASAIFICCHEWQIGRETDMMIHEPSFGLGGKGSDVKRWHEHLARSNDDLLRNFYTGFLEEEEIEKVLEGREFWMASEEIGERIQKLAEHRLGAVMPEPAESHKHDFYDEPIQSNDLVLFVDKGELKEGRVASVSEEMVVVNVEEKSYEIKNMKKLVVIGDPNEAFTFE